MLYNKTSHQSWRLHIFFSLRRRSYRLKVKMCLSTRRALRVTYKESGTIWWNWSMGAKAQARGYQMWLFSCQNATILVFFSAYSQRIWAIFSQWGQVLGYWLAKFWWWHFWGTFWPLVARKSGSSAKAHCSHGDVDNDNERWVLATVQKSSALTGDFLTHNCAEVQHVMIRSTTISSSASLKDEKYVFCDY